MFFANKPDTIIHVQRSSLVVYTKQGEVARLSLPPEVEHYLEVYDGKKFRELLLGFVKEQKLKGRKVLISLGDEVVFQQTIPLVKETDVPSEQRNFEAKVPFEAEQRVLLTIDGKTRVFLLATNRLLYEPIVEVTTKNGNKVLAAVPAIVYQLRKNPALDKTTINAMLSNTKPLGYANFLER